MITVITPLHAAGNRYIMEAYQSLLAQTYTEWQWVVLCNNGGELPDDLVRDERVREVHVSTHAEQGIGALKRLACQEAKTPYVVELDCDDELAPAALARIAAAFDAGADFVYSDFAEWMQSEDGLIVDRWAAYPYGAAYGWRSYEVMHPYRHRPLIAMSAPPVTPHNVRLVEWTPNHVRAWRAEKYWSVDGHNPALPVADDHDLVVRMYLAGAKFVHVPECLYFYRVHPANTVSLRNELIRRETWGVYRRNIWALAEKFADDAGLQKIDLCGAIDCPPGYLSLDRHNASLCADLDGPWPLPDGSVGVLRAHDAVEHLRDPIHTMNEAFRVLAPGGFLMLSIPSTNGPGAFCDPTHVSFWNALSLRYYTEPQFRRYVPQFTGSFQALLVQEHYPTPWHAEVRMPYVEAHLAKLAPGYVPMGVAHP